MKKVTFIVIFFISLLFCQTSIGQRPIHRKTYLNTNKEVLNHNQQEDFKLLLNENSQIILLGEMHGYKEPQKIDFALLKYLNKTKGFRYYLAELDYFETYYFNKFLEKGNDSLLMIVFSVWDEQISQWANKDFLGKIKQIRELNQSLPDDKKIQFLGVDQIQSSIILKSYMIELLKEVSYKEGTNPVLDTLLYLARFPNKNLKQIKAFAPILQSDFNNNSVFYKNLFVERYFDFAYMIKNLLVKSVNRDSIINENFKLLMNQNHLENEKFYGLWGYYHINQNEINGEMPLAQLLKNTYTVSSIAIVTSKSENMCPSTSLPRFIRVEGKKFGSTKAVNNDGFLFSTKGINNLKKVSQSNTSTLFKLNGLNSPYNKGLLLCKTKGKFGGGIIPTNKKASTIDYFQYIILVRDSRAVDSFEE